MVSRVIKLVQQMFLLFINILAGNKSIKTNNNYTGMIT